MTESTPHQISEPVQIPEPIKEILDPMLNYIAKTEFEDLIQRCIEECWTLDQAREHIAFRALLLEWYMVPSEDPNPERWALRAIRDCANEDDYKRLDPSLQFHG